jgi:hypothetical protein
MGNIQARVSLQTGFAMVFNTAGDAGITCDTASGISDNEAVHGTPLLPFFESPQPHLQAGHTEKTFPISFTSSKRREYLDSQAT